MTCSLVRISLLPYHVTHPSVLLTVTKIDTDMRTSNYSWNPGDDTASPPSFVEFIEHEAPDVDKPWGSWVVEENRDVTITDTRYMMYPCSFSLPWLTSAFSFSCLQSIGFIQLDACDINPTNTDTTEL